MTTIGNPILDGIIKDISSLKDEIDQLKSKVYQVPTNQEIREMFSSDGVTKTENAAVNISECIKTPNGFNYQDIYMQKLPDPSLLDYTRESNEDFSQKPRSEDLDWQNDSFINCVTHDKKNDWMMLTSVYGNSDGENGCSSICQDKDKLQITGNRIQIGKGDRHQKDEFFRRGCVKILKDIVYKYGRDSCDTKNVYDVKTPSTSFIYCDNILKRTDDSEICVKGNACFEFDCFHQFNDEFKNSTSVSGMKKTPWNAWMDMSNFQYENEYQKTFLKVTDYSGTIKMESRSGGILSKVNDESGTIRLLAPDTTGAVISRAKSIYNLGDEVVVGVPVSSDDVHGLKVDKDSGLIEINADGSNSQVEVYGSLVSIGGKKSGGDSQVDIYGSTITLGGEDGDDSTVDICSKNTIIGIDQDSQTDLVGNIQFDVNNSMCYLPDINNVFVNVNGEDKCLSTLLVKDLTSEEDEDVTTVYLVDYDDNNMGEGVDIDAGDDGGGSCPLGIESGSRSALMEDQICTTALLHQVMQKNKELENKIELLTRKIEQLSK